MKKTFLCVTAVFVACVIAYAGDGTAKTKKQCSPVYCTWTMQFGDTPVVRQVFTYDKSGRLASDSFVVVRGKWLLYDTAFHYTYNGDSITYDQSGLNCLLVTGKKGLPVFFYHSGGQEQRVVYHKQGTLKSVTSKWLNTEMPDSLRTTLYDSVVYKKGNIVSCIVRSGIQIYTQTFTYYDSLLYKPKFNSHDLHKPLADDNLEVQPFSKNLIKSVVVPESKFENYVHM